VPLTNSIYTITPDAPAMIVAPTVDSEKAWIQNLQPSYDMADYARDGYLYQISRLFPVAQNTTVSFNVLTGNTGLQIEYYDITSDTQNIYARLIENPTVVTNGTAIAAYNLNRNVSDTTKSVFTGVTSFTGGVTVASELVTAAKDAGGGASSSNVYTLKPNTNYVLAFQNVGNQDTQVHFHIGFAEQYNGYQDVWLGTAENSVRLRGGESVQLDLLPYETINATTTGDSVQVAVLRQD
jgi:hypothetical protein